MEATRTFFLALAKNRPARNMAAKYGLRFGAKRFVAGETLPEALEQIKRLNREGIAATLDRLGEFVSTREEAERAAGWSLETLEGIARSGVESHLSLKLTQLGLDLGSGICEKNLRQILTRAAQHKIFVRIDMEDFPRCQATIDLFQTMRRDFPLIGLVLQSYLYRSEQDVLDLKANLRLVKGAYKEPASVAFPEKAKVDGNLLRLVRLQLDNGWYVGVASHDEKIIASTKDYVREHNIDKECFEFQMLYGIKTEVQKKLAQEGYKVRVYVPYGTDWYGYFMRRLAERPANVWFIVKNFFKK
ncbi:proline dehydrogenase [Acididesulfobacillus acetoxydans]|uniref:proline dehydrogenase n=1 Tax=Acididesulfobacillus acetoxydans TaxID=1561005 RepID=A0A8S0W7X8_9FIRM|nr:proline dehydrogenase family protein [Acididesulfobacillus acetoxydans]CAA7601259.1 proline dehydrogenase [Acididesulfobacillus acetoxydans]CEJ08462.1 Proline dehydrogenase 1 [Acididesulfobacillus acetoxydans]